MRLLSVTSICLMVALVKGEPPVPSSYGAPQQGFRQEGPSFGQVSPQYGSPGPQPTFNQQQQYSAPGGGPGQFGQQEQGGYPQQQSESFGKQNQGGYPQQQPQSFGQTQHTSQPGPAPQPQSFYGQPGGGPSPQYQQPEPEQQEGGKIHKHIYVHIAPEEKETKQPPKERKSPIAPEKHYKILFIKVFLTFFRNFYCSKMFKKTAPSPSDSVDEEIQLPPAPEQKTLVYVLLQKPNFGPGGINVLKPKPTKPSKPEVYFIRYKGGQRPQNNQYGAPEPQSQGPPPPQYNAPRQHPPPPSPPQQQYGGPQPNGFGSPQQQYEQYSQPQLQQQYSQPLSRGSQQYGAPFKR